MKAKPEQAGKRVVMWLRSPPVRRGLLVTAVLGVCFAWAMVVVGMSFAMVERGARQWWLVLVFGLLVLVVALAAAYGVLVSFRRVSNARGAAPSAGLSARHDAPCPTPQAPAATVAASPASAGEARQAAARPQPPLPTARLPIEPLSRRELEVLAQLAAGRSNSEIAQALYVAGGTVKAHLNHIFRKLEATSRLQAVAHARKAGLLDAHEPK